jgi:hypothetical protein
MDFSSPGQHDPSPSPSLVLFSGILMYFLVLLNPYGYLLPS